MRLSSLSSESSTASGPYGGLFDALPGDPSVDRLIDDNAFVAAILRFEAALATAQSEIGVIPPDAARDVADACSAYRPDLAQLGTAAAASASPVVAIVSALGSSGASWVHYGATSQDCIDTAFSLCLKSAIGAVANSLDQAIATLRALAEAHVATPITARSLGQSASPTTFGFKICTWLEGLSAARAVLDQVTTQVLAVQCGGAVGTLSAMGPQGPAVVRRVAELLDLQTPQIAWHAERSRVLTTASGLTSVIMAAAKVAVDVVLMAQAEVGELSLGSDPEQASRGSSSAMPHKRNAVSAILIRAAGVQAPHLLSVIAAAGAGAHERSFGEWQAEWRPLRELAHLAGGAAHELAAMTRDLIPNIERMSANLLAGGGVLLAEAVTLALAPSMGRTHAHRVVQEACQLALAEKRTLAEVLAQDAAISTAISIDSVLDPTRATDSAARLAATYLSGTQLPA